MKVQYARKLIFLEGKVLVRLHDNDAGDNNREQKRKSGGMSSAWLFVQY